MSQVILARGAVTKPAPAAPAPKLRTASPTNWPERVEFKRVQEALEGKRPVSELSPQERELAAKYYRDIVSTIKEGKGAKQGYDFKAFNEERARFLEEGGQVPPGKITDFTKRTK